MPWPRLGACSCVGRNYVASVGQQYRAEERTDASSPAPSPKECPSDERWIVIDAPGRVSLFGTPSFFTGPCHDDLIGVAYFCTEL